MIKCSYIYGHSKSSRILGILHLKIPYLGYTFCRPREQALNLYLVINVLIFNELTSMNLPTKYIIALQQLQGYGSVTIKKILDLLKNHNIATLNELYEFINYNIDEKKIIRVKKKSYNEYEDALITANSIVEKSITNGVQIISMLDKQFPENLLSTIDEEGKLTVPIILYYKGDISVTKRKGIAIIGTREPTSEGKLAGEYYGKLFAEAGYNIISGLAIGCDTAGHKGALSIAGGLTTSFMAHGLDKVYPEENTRLAEEIVEKGGLLMSEYPIGINVNRYNLVARDRLQAALADVTIVIQTGVNGGTMHASNAALKAGKPLFCVRYPKLMEHNKTQGNAVLVNKGGVYLQSSTALSQVETALADRYKSKLSYKQNSLFDFI